MRIYYSEGMKSKESNSPGRQEALESRTSGWICCEQWAILTERIGREEGGDERGGRGREREGPSVTQFSLLTHWGAGNSCLMKSSNYLAKERLTIS